MLKKIFLGGTALAFVAAATLAMPVTSAQAGLFKNSKQPHAMTCHSMVKAKFPKDMKSRRAAFKNCKKASMASKKSTKKAS